MTAKKKTILSIIIFPLLIVAVLIFIIYPLFLEIQRSSQNIIEQKVKLISLESQNQNLKKFKNSDQIFEQYSIKTDTLFINGEMPLDFINFLEKVKKDYSLSLKMSIGSVSKEAKDTWSSINFNINVTGDYDKFMKFLEKIETGPYLTEVNNLNLNKGEDKNEILSSFSLKAFVK